MIQNLAARAGQRGAQRKAGANAQRAEGAGVEPGQRFARVHHIRGGGHEVAAVGHQHGVVAGLLFQRAGTARSG